MRKFQVGDRARVAPVKKFSHHGRPGRVIRITQIVPAKHGRHCWYAGGKNGKGMMRWYRSDELRFVDEKDLRGSYPRNNRISHYDNTTTQPIGGGNADQPGL